MIPLPSSNALLGNNFVYTHTLTDDLKVWTDPNVNYFCITEFDNPKSSAPIITKSSYQSYTLVTDPQYYHQDKGFADTNPDIQISNTNNAREEADSSQDLEQLKSTVKAWASDPVKVTADGELNEVIGDWSVWIDGEFGEFTLGKTMHSQRILDERSFHIGTDKLLSDDGDLPENVEENTVYFTIVISSTEIKLASSKTDADNGEGIVIHKGTKLFGFGWRTKK